MTVRAESQRTDARSHAAPSRPVPKRDTEVGVSPNLSPPRDAVPSTATADMARGPLARDIAKRQAQQLAELALIGYDLNLADPFMRRLVEVTLEWAAEVELERWGVRT